MRGIKGETSFNDKQDEVITTFVSSTDSFKVVVVFDAKEKLKTNKVVIEDNGNIKEYNKDLLNTIPEEWTDVLNCMESLTAWFKLDTVGKDI